MKVHTFVEVVGNPICSVEYADNFAAGLSGSQQLRESIVFISAQALTGDDWRVMVNPDDHDEVGRGVGVFRRLALFAHLAVTS